MIKSIDLFAGIGGIRLGFEQAFREQIKTVFVSEWDNYAQKTYKANFCDDFDVAGDITKIPEEDIPDFDICLAGFPCQAFSMAGSRKGFKDDYKGISRGTLFFEVARICALHKPKVIFCENVKGLTVHDKGRTLAIIIKTLEEIGYKVFKDILNSRNFGVPQNRERIYIVAFRKDIAPEEFRFPTGQKKEKCIRDIMEEQPVDAKYYLSDCYMETLRKHKARHEKKGNGFGYEIRDLDEVAGAIVCGGMGRERNLIIDKRQQLLIPSTHIKGEINKEGIRKMTPREWARLQGFPDDYKLPVADVHLYKQFGNSVTVPVIREIALEIKKILNKNTITTKEREDNMITANRGEWAELYVLFKLLGEGKIYAADENLNKNIHSYLEIIKIFREEVKDVISEYRTGATVDIYLEERLVTRIAATDFLRNAEALLDCINTATGRAFSVTPDLEGFMRNAQVKQVKAKSISRFGLHGGKNDIVMEVRDPNMALVSKAGFSIKAKGKSPATLFNTAPASAFVYELLNMTDTDMDNINALYTNQGGKDKEARISYIKTHGIEVVSRGNKLVHGRDHSIFADNLEMVRGDMQAILNAMILAHYFEEGEKTKITDICDILIKINPLKTHNPDWLYPKAIKDFLYATFSGMTASERWDGRDKVNGGYIVAKENGEVLVFHTRDGESFKSYLFNNTKIDRPDASEKKGYPYAHVYKQGGRYFFDLNFQVRFIK